DVRRHQRGGGIRIVRYLSDLNDYVECPRLTAPGLGVARGECPRPHILTRKLTRAGGGCTTPVRRPGRADRLCLGPSAEAFLRDRIFEPLGIEGTDFSAPAPMLDRLAMSYSP